LENDAFCDSPCNFRHLPAKSSKKQEKEIEKEEQEEYMLEATQRPPPIKTQSTTIKEERRCIRRKWRKDLRRSSDAGLYMDMHTRLCLEVTQPHKNGRKTNKKMNQTRRE
jgi:hypothetical protein